MANNAKIQRTVKYSTSISFIAALLYFIMVAFLRTNLIFNFNFNPHSMTCHVLFGICYGFYIAHKFSTYIVFLFRLEIVFRRSTGLVSAKSLQCMRYMIGVLLAVFCVLIFATKKQEIITPKHSISLCTTADAFDEINVGSVGVILFVLTDVFISVWLLWLFTSKLYKTTQILKSTLRQDKNKLHIIKKVESQLIKATILVTISIISTLLFIFIGNLFWWP
eukprot:657982_1